MDVKVVNWVYKLLSLVGSNCDRILGWVADCQFIGLNNVFKEFNASKKISVNQLGFIHLK